MVEEAVPAVLLLEDEHEGDLVDSVVFEHVFIALLDDLFSLVDTHNLKCVVQVGDGDLLDLQNIVGVKDRLKIFRRQELRLEGIEGVVMRVSLLLFLD